MIYIGITGQQGFIGSHLFNSLKFFHNEFSIINFESDFFIDDTKLNKFVSSCDVIVHLAALNRHSDKDVIYETNIRLVKKIINSCLYTNSSPHIILSSSTQESNYSTYGSSKKEGRILFEKWSSLNGGTFTGLIIPNVFGPFGKPYYNSVVSTFSHQLCNNEPAKIDSDSVLNLIFIDDLISDILHKIRMRINDSYCIVKHTNEVSVSSILSLLNNFKSTYFDNGKIPLLINKFELDMFNTFRSHIDLESFFPKKYIQHTDVRGAFVELLRTEIGGQFSFSTTQPGVTRGNHYHSRKIERFSVISGTALIQMRKVGTDDIIEFAVDGKNPSFIDMPTWYTHNIKNIGNDQLLTNFWINEAYDERNPDTFFEDVNLTIK